MPAVLRGLEQVHDEMILCKTKSIMSASCDPGAASTT